MKFLGIGMDIIGVDKQAMGEGSSNQSGYSRKLSQCALATQPAVCGPVVLLFSASHPH